MPSREYRMTCLCLNTVDFLFFILNASGNVSRRQFGVNPGWGSMPLPDLNSLRYKVSPSAYSGCLKLEYNFQIPLVFFASMLHSVLYHCKASPLFLVPFLIE